VLLKSDRGSGNGKGATDVRHSSDMDALEFGAGTPLLCLTRRRSGSRKVGSRVGSE